MRRSRGFPESAAVLAAALLAMAVPAACGGDRAEIAGPAGPEPAPDCPVLEPLGVRADPPAAVSVLFARTECGDAVTDPAEPSDVGRVSVVEGGADLAADAHRQLLAPRGLVHVVHLLLDVTDGARAGRVAEAQAAAALARDLLDLAGADVLVGVTVYDGGPAPVALQQALDDPGRVADALDGLPTLAPPDPGARNLHGALAAGVAGLRDFLAAIEEEGRGGILATGHLVVTAAGPDTAGRMGGSAAQAAVRDARTRDGAASAGPAVRVVGVGPFAGELLEGTLPWAAEDRVADLAAAAATVGRRIARTDLLAYCSANRAGEHWVTVGLTDAAGVVTASTRLHYRADGFTGGCHSTFFRTACDDRECGGWLCGRCDPETERCDPGEVAAVCRDRCQGADPCDAGALVHPLGYPLACDAGGGAPAARDHERCDGECVDLARDRDHCGACGRRCTAAGSTCEGGDCVCPGAGDELCGGQCVVTSSDIRHCGRCANACEAGVERCVAGECVCADGDLDGDGVCDGDDEDGDGDGCPDGADPAPDEAAPDADGDGVGDDCDPCPAGPNGDDADGDGAPDACDLCTGDDAAGDADGDGVCDDVDACAAGRDGDDADGDGAADACDACPGLPDGDDADGDGVADGCDACAGDDAAGDADGDGTCDNVDACPLGPEGDDADGDGAADACDACPGFADGADADGDAVPDGCDLCAGDDAAGDGDGDGTCDDVDPCPLGPEGDDADGDGAADACDACPGFPDGADADGDAVPDGCDACAGDDSAGDADLDGTCDDLDDDDDDDGCPDPVDAAPIVPSGDADGDGVGDDCDPCQGDDDPACRCAEDAREQNDRWHEAISPDDGGRHGRGRTELAGLTLSPGDEDWFAVTANSSAFFAAATATLAPDNHCPPPPGALAQRVCMQMAWLTWADYEGLLGDGQPDLLGQPVCGPLAGGLSAGPFRGGLGFADLWLTVLVRVWFDPAADPPPAAPAPYRLTIRP